MAASLAAIALACTPAQGRHDVAPAPPVAASAAADAQSLRIDHVSPRRDSTGPIPARLEWTPVKGADSYTVGVWNEVDVMVWKRGRLTNASVDWPQDVVLDPGTYFWSVMAFRDDRPIADSGRAAFIVVR